jgi:hypothetical protein
MQRTTIAKRSVNGTEAAAAKRLLKDYEVEAQYGISKFTLRPDRIHEQMHHAIQLTPGERFVANAARLRAE